MGGELHTCERCEASFFYDPANHRCPGEWEAIAGPPPSDPYAGMTWAEEMTARQRDADRT